MKGRSTETRLECASHEYCIIKLHNSIRSGGQGVSSITSVSATVQLSNTWQSRKYGVSHSTSVQARSVCCSAVFGCRGLSTSEESLVDAGHVQQCLCVKNNGERLVHDNAHPHMANTNKTKVQHVLGGTGVSGVQYGYLPMWHPHHWATEAGTQGMLIPVRCKSGEMNCSRLFPAAAFKILRERYPVLVDSAGHRLNVGSDSE
jgi:hypothetical protein